MLYCLFNSRNFLKRSYLIIEKRRQKSNEEVEDENVMDTLQAEGKKKKLNHKNHTTKKSVQEELLEISKAQLKSLEESEKRQQEFYAKFIEEQRKEEAKEREKDHEFFMNLAKLFSK